MGQLFLARSLARSIHIHFTKSFDEIKISMHRHFVMGLLTVVMTLPITALGTLTTVVPRDEATGDPFVHGSNRKVFIPRNSRSCLP